MFKPSLVYVIVLCLCGIAALWLSAPTAQAAVEPVITNYYTPCRSGTDGTVSTWHGKNRDGKPPYDPNRRTYDFRCVDTEIYTPAAGVVYGVTLRFGGVVLIDDAENGVCMVFLGMNSIALEPKQVVKTGTYVGTYRLFHFTAVDGNCARANWYDVPARERERPINFIEFGEVIAPDIRRTDPYTFTSQNPTRSTVRQVQLFYVSLDAELCSDVPLGECPIGTVGIAHSLISTDERPETLISALLTDLFTVKDQTIAPFDLYNPLAYSTLAVDSVVLDDEALVVNLSGVLVLADPCDGGRLVAQLEQSVGQFLSAPRPIRLLLNGAPLADQLPNQP